MNLKFIRVDYPRLKARVIELEENGVASGGVQPDDLADVAFSGDYDDLINKPSGVSNNTVTDYRSIFEDDLYIYSGFLLNLTPTIRRFKNGVYEEAQGLTDLETDWTNRLTLTYI